MNITLKDTSVTAVFILRPVRIDRFIRGFTAAAALITVLSSQSNAALPGGMISTSTRTLMPLSGAGWEFLGTGADQVLPEYGSKDYESAPWTPLQVPHEFQNRTDMSIVQGWYRRSVTIPSTLAHKRLYLVFEGAATVADVYVNGNLLGEHRGAFTRFIFDATSNLHAGKDNTIAIRIDNRPSSVTDCLPSSNGLYTVWGGLYRHVWLLAANDLEIDPAYYASPGVFVTPSSITRDTARLSVKVMLRNASASVWNASVTATVYDPAVRRTGSFTTHTIVEANQTGNVLLSGSVAHPELWSPESPNLYHVLVQVKNEGVVTDSVVQPLGFHTVDWDLANGLVSVNGHPYTLYGVDLHQEIETRQSAVEPADLIENITSLKDLGVNFVRFSHYPRAQVEYDQCDERGLFCWAENGHSHNDLATPTADQITTEMVEQNYNHPSIIIWSVGNEGNAAPSEREVPVVKSLDQTRPVMVANMRCANADYIAKNLYPGWYSADRWTFQPSGLISEIGAGGVVTSHTDYANAHHTVNSFEPEEYQQLVAETDFEQAFNHSAGKLGMFTWWCMRDFTDNKYKLKSAPYGHGLNTKGLETYSGSKKDVYYLYRCFLRPNVPTLHITSKEYFLRTATANNGVKIYSSAESVTLKVNGTVVSTKLNGNYAQNDALNATDSGEIDHVFYWPVVLCTGRNEIDATDSFGDHDSATVYFYGAGGLPEQPDSNELVTNLNSSNPANSVYYMDMPVQPQWPIYYDFDSTADNSLDELPEQVRGAAWFALRRVTRPGEATTISFTSKKPITVYVIATKEPSTSTPLTVAGFSTTLTPPFEWRGNDMVLVPADLYSRTVTAGEQVTIPLGDRDELVLVKTSEQSSASFKRDRSSTYVKSDAYNSAAGQVRFLAD